MADILRSLQWDRGLVGLIKQTISTYVNKRRKRTRSLKVI